MKWSPVPVWAELGRVQIVCSWDWKKVFDYMIKDRFLCVALQICATKETVRIFFLSLHTKLILQYIYKHLYKHKQHTWLTSRKGIVFKYYISQVPDILALSPPQLHLGLPPPNWRFMILIKLKKCCNWHKTEIWVLYLPHRDNINSVNARFPETNQCFVLLYIWNLGITLFIEFTNLIACL